MRLRIAGLLLAYFTLSLLFCAALLFCEGPQSALAEPTEKISSGKNIAAAKREQAARFAAQLGSENFALREQASERLLKLGLASAAALEKSSKSLDPEVRYRAERLLVLIREKDFEQRLELFAADKQNSRDYGLPGWNQYRKVAGEDVAAKQLFISMQKSEQKLFQALELDSHAAAAAIKVRSIQLFKNSQTNGHRTELGSMATLLLASSLPDIQLDNQSMDAVTNLCNRASAVGLFEFSQDAKPLRKLLAAWVVSSRINYSLQVLLISLQSNLSEGSQVAKRVLENPESISRDLSFSLTYAMIALARLGGETDIPLLEKQLSNKNHVLSQTSNAPNRQNQIQIQVRDVALAALLSMAKQNPKDYGIEKYESNSVYLFNIGTLGFESEEKRAAALKKWRAFQDARRRILEKKTN